MEFQATPWYGESYNKVTVTGPVTLDRLLSLLQVLAIDSRSSQHGLLMVDLRGSEERLNLQERSRLGEELARSLAHLRGLALVLPRQNITGAIEQGARRLGANMRVFGSEGQALDWLASISETSADTSPAGL